MAIHPNSGVEFDATDPDLADPDDGRVKQRRPLAEDFDAEVAEAEANIAAIKAREEAARIAEAAKSDSEPKTVSVTSRLDRAIVIHQHEVIKDDGANRSFQGRRLDSPITINPGVNPGIDKVAFTNWQEQNSGSALHALFTVTDED